MTEEERKFLDLLQYLGEKDVLRRGKPPHMELFYRFYLEDVFAKAANLIESLSAQLEQVTRELDAAVRDAHGVCRACIHYNGHYPAGDIMSCCKFEECVHGADDWESEDHWQWRGVEVE